METAGTAMNYIAVDKGNFQVVTREIILNLLCTELNYADKLVV